VSQQYGTPDLLYYSHLGAEGIVILKDGSLLRTYRLHGPDLKSASVEELLSVKFHGNQALTRLDDGWMVQVDLVRFPSAEYLGGGEFPDATTRTIEHERELHYRAEGAHFDTAIYLTITYRPPSKRERRVMRLFVAEDIPDDQQNLAHFQTTTDALAHDLSAHLELTPLNSGQLLSFIESALIGEQVTIRPPRQFNYLDLFLGRHALVNTGAWPTIGGRAIRVVIPTGFPLESHAEVTAFLCELPFSYRYSIRAVLLGTQAANAVIGTARKHWHQKILRARFPGADHGSRGESGLPQRAGGRHGRGRQRSCQGSPV
jgi:type IV secretion system protein VirB4